MEKIAQPPNLMPSNVRRKAYFERFLRQDFMHFCIRENLLDLDIDQIKELACSSSCKELCRIAANESSAPNKFLPLM